MLALHVMSQLLPSCLWFHNASQAVNEQPLSCIALISSISSFVLVHSDAETCKRCK